MSYRKVSKTFYKWNITGCVRYISNKNISRKTNPDTNSRKEGNIKISPIINIYSQI